MGYPQHPLTASVGRHNLPSTRNSSPSPSSHQGSTMFCRGSIWSDSIDRLAAAMKQSYKVALDVHYYHHCRHPHPPFIIIAHLPLSLLLWPHNHKFSTKHIEPSCGQKEVPELPKIASIVFFTATKQFMKVGYFKIGSNLIKYWQRISCQVSTMPHYQIWPDGAEMCSAPSLEGKLCRTIIKS